MARPPGTEDEVEGQDEEFVHHLGRGSDLLMRGDPAEALHSLERAAALRPDDGKVIGLLGQALYRIGRFEDAAEAYGRLVNDNPTEVAARVNLGLATLKAGRHAEAVKQFGIVLDLNPEHRKAMGYLGLAHLDAGNLRAAREWFDRAGSSMMVARCDELLAAGSDAGGPRPHPVEVVASPGAPALGQVEPSVEGISAEAVSAQAAKDRTEVDREPTPHVAEPRRERAPEPSAAAARVAPVVPVAPPPVPGPMTAPAVPAAEAGLAAFAAGRTLRAVAPEAGGDPFLVEGRVLSVAVRNQVLARMDGLFAVRGEVALTPELKRFRGKPTDKAFGDGPERMHRASGDGTLLYRTGGRTFTSVDLGGDAGYFREEAVFALEEHVVFENGRVPARQGRDLNLVHLRGRGRFLLRTTGAPVSLEVVAAAPLRVPAEALVGWTGALTPRIVPLAGEPGTPEAVEGAALVELTGDGRVLVDPDAAVAE
jgi:uncharacterized protein (AIM24 family)/thioredoxin-like negative regulator of GroEL